MSLRARILLGYTLLLAAALCFFAYLILNDVRPRYLESVEDSAVDTAELLAAILTEQSLNRTLDLAVMEAAMNTLAKRSFSAQIYDANKQKAELRVYVTDGQGVLLYDSSGQNKPGTDFSQWRDVHLTLRGLYGARTTRSVPDDPASSVIYVAAPILKSGELLGVVTVGKPQDSISFFIAIARKKLGLTLLLIVLTATGIAAAFSVWITGPLKRLTAYVHAVRQGKNETMPALGSSEIGVLGKAIGEMQAEIDGKKYIEDYVRALTHELKSPLTGIKGAAEILRDQITGPQTGRFLDNIDTETERMQGLVQRMLQLSRLENARDISKTRFKARDLLDEIAESFRTRLADKSLSLAITLPPGLALHGDRLLLGQAVGNLLSNAVDFSPPGADISLSAAPEGQAVCITVRDRGCGIPDFAEDKVFDKFFSLSRPDGGKKSSGLGLPFVREIVALHQGEIVLVNAAPGLEARIVLPQE